MTKSVCLNTAERESIKQQGSMGINDQNFYLLLETCDTLERLLQGKPPVKETVKVAKPSKDFFIASVMNTPDGLVNFLSNDDENFTTNVREAGIYGETDAAAMNDGKETKSIPVVDVFPGETKFPAGKFVVVVKAKDITLKVSQAK